MVAEEEGFEPPEALTSTVFKTAAFDHSAIPPQETCGSTHLASLISNRERFKRKKAHFCEEFRSRRIGFAEMRFFFINIEKNGTIRLTLRQRGTTGEQSWFFNLQPNQLL